MNVGAEDVVFSERAARATGRSYVGAAGIEYGTKSSGFASMYAGRKSFATWLDDAGVSEGVREWLLCHWDPYVKPSLESQREALRRLPRIFPDLRAKCVENGRESRIDSVGGPKKSLSSQSVQQEQAQHTTPGHDQDRQALDSQGSLRFEGGKQPSTPDFQTENGHSRFENEGICQVLSRALAALEEQGRILRLVVEACERQGAFDGGRSESGGGEDLPPRP